MITVNIYWKNSSYSTRFHGIPSAIQPFNDEHAMERCIAQWMEEGGVWVREGSEEGPLLMTFPWSMVHHVEVVRPVPNSSPEPTIGDIDHLTPSYRGGM